MNKHTTPSNEKIYLDHTRYERPSHAIAISIAAVKNIEVTELEPLFDSIDPEALDQLFRHVNSNEKLVVDLRTNGYDVTIHNTGELVINEPVTQSE